MWIADIDALRLDFKWWRIVDSPAAHRITIPSAPSPRWISINRQPKIETSFFVETIEQSIDISVYHYNQVMYNIWNPQKVYPYVSNLIVQSKYVFCWSSCMRTAESFQDDTYMSESIIYLKLFRRDWVCLVKKRPQLVRFNVRNWNMQMSPGFFQYLRNICEIYPGFKLDIPISHV